VLVGLNARGEKIDVGLERRLERLVPVFQIRQDWQRLRGQRIQAGCECIRGFAFVNKKSELRIADRQLPAILNFAVLHGVSIGQNPVFRFHPVDYIDELLGDKIAETHKPLLSAENGLETQAQVRPDANVAPQAMSMPAICTG
jgi:hypothetical protein